MRNNDNRTSWDDLENGDLMWDELPDDDKDALLEYAIRNNKIRIDEPLYRLSRKK